MNINVYIPPWAPHIEGRYEDRGADPDAPGDQKFSIMCHTCGTSYKGTCTSGMVRNHVVNFALAHTHKDPLNP